MVVLALSNVQLNLLRRFNLLRPSGTTFPPLRYFLGLASKAAQDCLSQTGHDLTISFDCLKP